MRSDFKLIRGLGVSTVALLLLVGGVTAASPGATQSRGTHGAWRSVAAGRSRFEVRRLPWCWSS
jgi:hypothetical protein